MKRFILATAATAVLASTAFGQYKDVISVGGWEGSSDSEFGSSSVVTIDSTEEGVINSVAAVITKGENVDYAAYASLAVYYEGNLEGAESIILTYTSDKQVWFTLPMKDVTDSDGSAHGVVLDPAENKVDTLALADFAQPLWWREDTTNTMTALDPAAVFAMGWELEDAPTDEAVINVTVSGLLVDNITWGDETAPILGSVLSNSVNSIVTGFTASSVQLSVPTSGNYDVALYAANGRLIQSSSVALSAGSVNSVELTEQSSGIYFVQVVGQAVNVTEKVTLN